MQWTLCFWVLQGTLVWVTGIKLLLLLFLLSQDSEENKDDFLSRTLRVTFSSVGPLLSLPENLVLLFLCKSAKDNYLTCCLLKLKGPRQNLSCWMKGVAANLLTSLLRVANCLSVQSNCEAAPLCEVARSRSPRLDTPHPTNTGRDACRPRPWRQPDLHPLQVSLGKTGMSVKCRRWHFINLARTFPRKLLGPPLSLCLDSCVFG